MFQPPNNCHLQLLWKVAKIRFGLTSNGRLFQRDHGATKEQCSAPYFVDLLKLGNYHQNMKKTRIVQPMMCPKLSNFHSEKAVDVYLNNLSFQDSFLILSNIVIHQGNAANKSS